jgi:magnesium transporter
MSDVMVPGPQAAGGDPDTAGAAAPSVSDSEPPQCATRTREYRDGRLVDEGFPAQEISERLDADGSAVLWLDLHDPDATDLSIVIGEFGLHPLAVEDAVHDHQRPKLDRYRSHLFAAMYAVSFDATGGRLITSEINAFITPRALITVRKGDFDIDTLVARWEELRELAATGVGYLVYGLLDAVVDGHYQAAQALNDAVDELEDALFDPATDFDIHRRGFELRKSQVRLRRVIVPMREILARLERGEGQIQLVTEELVPYFQDVHDHVLRAADDVEAAHDLIGSVLETNYTEQSNELNEVTKKLAAWAAIIAVPTAVTGFYGQNVPYPGFGQHWGFLVSTLVIVLLGGGLWVALRRRGWL